MTDEQLVALGQIRKAEVYGDGKGTFRRLGVDISPIVSWLIAEGYASFYVSWEPLMPTRKGIELLRGSGGSS